MGNKLYVTKVPTPNFKIMHPDNTVICQLKISRAAMKRLKKQQKQQAPAKERKNNIFKYSRNVSSTGAFFYAHNFL
jgi:hypothetical protein